MQAFKTIAPLQQLTALATAAVLTAGLLFSLGAQADTEHAAALASAQVNAQLACAAPQRSASS
jgi:hypothetical protein